MRWGVKSSQMSHSFSTLLTPSSAAPTDMPAEEAGEAEAVLSLQLTKLKKKGF